MGVTLINKVRILHGGEPFKGRVLNISSSIESFQTPTRIPTSTELNAKIRIHLDEPWDNQVFEVTNRFNNIEQVRRLHRKNGAFSDKRRKLTAQIDKFKGYSITKYHPQIPLGTILNERDIMALVDLQLEAGSDIVSIPEPSPLKDLKKFERNFVRYWNNISDVNENTVVMPYISLSQDNDIFEQKLEVFSNYEHTLHCIGIRFASPQEYRPNLFSLAEFSSKDFWIHCSAGKKFPNWQKPNAQLHALQRFGIDTVSVEAPLPPFRFIQESGPENVRYFHQKTVTYPQIKDIVTEDGHLDCNCPVCNMGTLDDLISNVENLGPKDEIKLRVNDSSKVHEVYSSTDEFETSRKRIKEDSLLDYFKNKKGLRPFIKNDKKQKQVTDYLKK